ncbi:GrpB family protein [Chryseobacterium pennipullorum]|uniref:GrpB family protein n=1 Tax=Chryseobacterium pennipullorum TaxID=2258963 RepID=A0A3D9APZ9_9FLAO|nr:GrpB family protein [Chryseobacterium pennipullorum]REC43403.1 GrpB family protein [Chryseobacterium pennipullorum]
MRITFEPYNPLWKNQFEQIKSELEGSIGFLCPQIEHIGSTSVEGLSAKPIIDIMIGVKDEEDLDKVPPHLRGKEYVYYEKYNDDMPYRRFFIRLKDTARHFGFPDHILYGDDIPEGLHDHSIRIAHLHVISTSSEHWLRHIAFRDYLRAHPEVRREYQQLKEELSTREWFDGNDYNQGKDPFIKREERNAVQWYLAQHKDSYTI